MAHVRLPSSLRCSALLLCLWSLAACASLPPPTNELAAAQQAVARAEAADGDQYAGPHLAAARDGLGRAQAAMAEGNEDDARILAVAAAADADLAYTASRAEVTRVEFVQGQAELAALRERLGMEAEPALPDPFTDERPQPIGVDQVEQLNQRLTAIAADARLTEFAAYERLQARQAVDALAAARNRDRGNALYVAERRVRVAEGAARVEALRRETDRIDRERNELLVEASRQDAERARQEAERLRIEAQIQAEETQRLRAAAEAEALARQEAEGVIQEVAGDQAARLAAAREKEAALARQEAELLAGGTLPPSKQGPGGELFTLAGDAFASGQATLTGKAKASLQALAAYLQAGPAARVRVEGHTDSQGEADANQQLSQRRAEAVRDALVAAGVPRGRIEAVGRGESQPVADNLNAAGRARNRRVEILVQTGN